MKRLKIEYLVSFAALALVCFLVGVFVGRNSVHISGGVILEMETATVEEVPSNDEGGEEESEEPSETVGDLESPAPLPATDEEETTGALYAQEDSDERMNINTATAAELETLPGIGEVLSQRIVEYREEHGPFESVEEIMLVSGIGEKKFEAIRSMITVR